MEKFAFVLHPLVVDDFARKFPIMRYLPDSWIEGAMKHVKSFENKYSMRIYEWLLKELTQRKTHKANIEISLKNNI